MNPVALPPLVVGALALAFTVFCLIDLARAKEVRYLSRWAWAIVICLGSLVGGSFYLAFGRTR